jgi:hypothetical protein
LGVILMACCGLLGLLLRFDQLVYQVPLDDEWHALHQVISTSPSRFIWSFGLADYSIPLTLLYWLEAHFLGLSEWGMRWPMLAAGCATLVALPIWVARRFGWRVAVLFALLLAISPLLINYSRYARPYALTLFLGYVAHYAFWRFLATRSWASGVLYAGSAALTVWLHLVTLPFVTAPFFLALPGVWRDWRGDGPRRLVDLLKLGLPSALLTSLLILPPLLGDPGALKNKSGSDLPNWDTLVGVAHTWLGTPSLFVVVVACALAALGFVQIWRERTLLRGVLLGLALTLGMILIARPAWVHIPLTFGRYLLPGMLILLLSVALGAAKLSRMAERRWGPAAGRAVMLLPAALVLWHSPLKDVLRQPNSYTVHSMFQVDFRSKPDSIGEIMRTSIPLSPWWGKLRAGGKESVLIAVAPFQYFSPRWDAPRWEHQGKQRIIPGYLSGLCQVQRDGELPHDARFTMRNAVHLGDDEELRRKDVAYVVYQRPFRMTRFGMNVSVGYDTEHCYASLRGRFGAPGYEDDTIAVFSLPRLGSVQPHAQP